MLHSFYRLADGSFLAFFEAPDSPFEFKEQHDFDLHVAMEVTPERLDVMLAKARAAGREARGPSDHGIIRSIYLRDPSLRGRAEQALAPHLRAQGFGAGRLKVLKGDYDWA